MRELAEKEAIQKLKPKVRDGLDLPYLLYHNINHKWILNYDYMLFKSNLNMISSYLKKLPKYIYNTDGLINDLLTANNEVNCCTKQYLIFAALQKG